LDENKIATFFMGGKKVILGIIVVGYAQCSSQGHHLLSPKFISFAFYHLSS